MTSESAKDFFISYTQADQRWAEWVAWQLEEAGYTVIIQAWDFAAGVNFLSRMDSALKETDRTLLILTSAALDSRFVHEEWAAALKQERLVPVRVQKCDPAALLSTRAYIDLVGLEEHEARERLLAELQKGRRKPDEAPAFPGALSEAKHSVPQKPAFPGALPPFWQAPYSRNPAFTGREALLTELRQALTSGENAALTQAITGLGGVGKTQLAL